MSGIDSGDTPNHRNIQSDWLKPISNHIHPKSKCQFLPFLVADCHGKKSKYPDY